MKMNVQSANTSSTNDFARCQHRTPSGRRCKSTASAPNASLCYTHAQSQQKAKEAGDLSSALLQNYQNFQTAQGVNFALANIYRLLAANRISARRASVLAYINSLLLRTLPAIDADFENGITDPTAPKKDEAEAACSTTNVEEATATAANHEGTPAWVPSIPELDLTKKPS
jgi:hypothetical protein